MCIRDSDSGDRVSFTCRADGVPTPTISWLKDGTIVSTSIGKKYEVVETTLSGGFRENINEAVSSVLSVVGLSESDSGLYVCTASNQQGQNAVLETPFNLTVNPPVLPDFCSPSPCLNGASCESGDITYVCKCTSGFGGINCEEGMYIKLSL